MKSTTGRRWDMEMILGYLLLMGVGLSAAFLMAGLLWKWIETGDPHMRYTLSGTNLFEFCVLDLREVLRGPWRPRLFTNLGVAVLLLTPFLRVATSAVYFAVIERNRKYTFFTMLVLAILTYSLFLR